MAGFKEGDAVAVATREQVAADIKSQLYYPHFAGVRGSILKLYGEEASVLVERETLPTEIRTRHVENERASRQRWLDGLSEEGRNRLSAKEKNFSLNYTILVGLKDLVAAPASEVDNGKRLTDGDLTAAEEAFLKEREAKK